MNKLMRVFSLLFLLSFSLLSFSAEQLPQEQSAEEKTVQVGKYVTPSTDASTMILSLLLVLIVVIASAYVLKKFQGTTQNTSHLKVVTSLHLGAKERIVVVQVGEKQLLLGVTATQISVLDTLEQPLETGRNVSELFDNSVVSMLKKSINSKGNKNV